MTGHKLDLINIDAHTKFGLIMSIHSQDIERKRNSDLNVNDDVLTKFGWILLLSGNEILTSIKGRNSVKILRKMTGSNPKLDPVNVDVHTKFGRILSYRSQDIERKQNSDVNQGP